MQPRVESTYGQPATAVASNVRPALARQCQVTTKANLESLYHRGNRETT